MGAVYYNWSRAFHMTGYPNIQAPLHDLHDRSLLYSRANQALISSVGVVLSFCIMLYCMLSDLFLHRLLVPYRQHASLDYNMSGSVRITLTLRRDRSTIVAVET
jgi:hypothetical protein